LIDALHGLEHGLDHLAGGLAGQLAARLGVNGLDELLLRHFDVSGAFEGWLSPGSS
jgi:hypothetical protein